MTGSAHCLHGRLCSLPAWQEVPIARVAHPGRHPAVGEDGRAMTSLITRPSTAAPRTGEADPGRPLATVAGLAGASAAVIGLVLCMSVALTGWFLADAGAHGDTTDALRVGAVAWLTGHGSHLVVSGVPLGVTPLAVTMMLVLTAFRGGRWATRHAVPVEDDRGLAGAVASFACGYVVVVVVTCVVASQTAASPVLGRALLGALAGSALAGGLGLAVGTGRLTGWLDRAPGWLVDVGTGAATGVLWLLAAGAALVAVSLLLSFNEAATVLSGLHLSTGDALSYTVVMALFAPNAALFGVAYLLGPGFAFGTATTVSPTAVSLGVVPAFPMLAALPDEGPTPGWLVVLLAVPALAAALGIGQTLRRHDPVAHDLAALRGAGAGFLAGVLVTVLVALSGGALGTGRMADVGAPPAEVLVFATGLMTAGGLVGALAVNWWRRRGGLEVQPRAERVDDGAEPTVEVLR
jgi:hypothetical protein